MLFWFLLLTLVTPPPGSVTAQKVTAATVTVPNNFLEDVSLGKFLLLS